MNTNQLRLKGGQIAQQLSPADTFNLALSIITMDTPRGFTIIQRSSDAFYGEIINDGRTDRPLSAKEQGNVGWWEDKTFNAIIRFMATNQNNIKKEYQQAIKQAEKTPARLKTHARSLARSGK